MIKTVVVDDESAGRKLIKEYLSQFLTFEIVGEASDGKQAVEVINNCNPDLVFMDIQMPGLTGFEVLLKLEKIPQIIFSTAFDTYALEAFEIHAVDYLLKPYDQERFKKAIGRISPNNEISKIASLAESLSGQTIFYDNILVNKNNRLVSIKTASIIWIGAYGDYSKIYTQNDFFVSNYRISELEKKLNPQFFLRVHRSSIINIEQIKSIEKYRKSYEIKMMNGQTIRVSLTHVTKLKELIF